MDNLASPGTAEKVLIAGAMFTLGSLVQALAPSTVILIEAIEDSSTVWLFALFCVLAWVWIYFRVPETKGQSLEHIQQLWKQPA